jgi:dUTPase
MSEINDLNKLRDRILKLQESLQSETEVSYEDILNEMDIDIVQLEKDMIETKRLLPLGYKVLHPDAVLPKYNYGSDSGFDLHSVDTIEIPPFGRALVPTGLSFDIQDGYEIQVRTKSGLAINQGLMVLNSPGTVD